MTNTTPAADGDARAAFEAHWLTTRGHRKATRELQRRARQPQVYACDSANRHWVTWQAARRDAAAPAPATVTLTALNLRNALDFVAPDFETDEDQRESEVTIVWAPDRQSIDGDHLPAGYYCWLADYPEEGCIPLDQGAWSAPPAAPAPQAVPAEPVQLLRFAVWDDGELRLLSGRKGPAFDCELYAMPDGKSAPPLYAAPAAPAADAVQQITWPAARDVGRIGDMSPSAHMRIGFDSDNDVFVSVWGEDGGGSVEFCNGGGGGGQSMRTRLALIALMVAIEADNAEKPSRDWWAQRATQGGRR